VLVARERLYGGAFVHRGELRCEVIREQALLRVRRPDEDSCVKTGGARNRGIGLLDVIRRREEDDSALFPQLCDLGQHARGEKPAEGIAPFRAAVTAELVDLVE
jgi:hypothetical protein